MKFKAWDKIHNKWIQLWKILISSDGSIVAVEDLEGEVYGLHQVSLFLEVK